MTDFLHDLKDPKLGELWYIPCCGKGRIYIINRSTYKQGNMGNLTLNPKPQTLNKVIWEPDSETLDLY